MITWYEVIQELEDACPDHLRPMLHAKLRIAARAEDYVDDLSDYGPEDPSTKDAYERLRKEITDKRGLQP